jgi:hypothetical protein
MNKTFKPIFIYIYYMNEVMNKIQQNQIMDNNKVLEEDVELNETKTQKKVDECIELKNIEYQTMLLNSNSSSHKELRPKNNNNTSLKDVNEMLESEQSYEKMSWSRLTKSNKIKKIYYYVDELKEKNDLSEMDISDIKEYIKKCFDRKLLSKSKQIIYDKKNGVITDIPSLIILTKDTKRKKRFTMKMNDTKSSTLKNLSKGRASSRQELVKKMKRTSKDKDKNNS